MTFEEHTDGKWLVVTLVPGFIEAHSGVQFGTPTPISTRITTPTGAGAWINKEWDAYGSKKNPFTEQQALVCYAFEVGREYQRNRKLRKKISDACAEGWAITNAQSEVEEILKHQGEGI